MEGTQELSDVQRIVPDLQGSRIGDSDNPRHPGVMQQMKQDDPSGLARNTCATLRAYRTDRPHFIDKMPNNFRGSTSASFT